MLNLDLPKGYSILVPHTHTTASDGMVSPEEVVDAAADYADKLNTKIFLAITDHDTIQGVEKAQKRARIYPKLVEIICGEEITAGIPIYQKHIVALNIKKPIKHSMSIFETVSEIKRQNGLVIIPHPHVFGFPIASLTFREIKQVVKTTDGIETSSNSTQREVKIDQEFNKLGGKINRIGSSDSHYGKTDLLSSFTIFKGNTNTDLRDAFKNCTLKPVQGVKEFPMFSIWLKQKVKALGVLGVRRYLLGSLR